jgi:hypothetical protein
MPKKNAEGAVRNPVRNLGFHEAFPAGWDDLHTYKVRELSMSAGERGCARPPRAPGIPGSGKQHGKVPEFA